MDNIDREQKKEQLGWNTKNWNIVRQGDETWGSYKTPELQKDRPASWKEVSDASDKGFAYSKDGREAPSQEEETSGNVN
uniref:Uncharacterized protein n=1 Tax=Acrobeloides nanus TaxID=290746 RepID=A0A914EH87_9BILA